MFNDILLLFLKKNCRFEQDFIPENTFLCVLYTILICRSLISVTIVPISSNIIEYT